MLNAILNDRLIKKVFTNYTMLLISERQVAAEGLGAMESWMREIGCVMTISELGCDESITSLLVFDSFLYCDLK